MTDRELIELIRKIYGEENREYITEHMRNACQFCPNNLQNGGSGVCYCTLGSHAIITLNNQGEAKMHEECKGRDFHPLAMCDECEYFPCELVADWFTDIPSGIKETKR